jgi:hypothetical protein
MDYAELAWIRVIHPCQEFAAMIVQVNIISQDRDAESIISKFISRTEGTGTG